MASPTPRHANACSSSTQPACSPRTAATSAPNSASMPSPPQRSPAGRRPATAHRISPTSSPTPLLLNAAARALGELSPALADEYAPLLLPINQLRAAAVQVASAVAITAVHEGVA